MIKKLLQTPLFKNFKEADVQNLLKSVSFEEVCFTVGDVIYEEGERVDQFGVLLEGKIEAKQCFADGTCVSLHVLEQSDVFGEALIYSSHGFVPMTLEAREDVRVCFFKREEFNQLMAHPVVRENFLFLLSDKIYLLNDKLKLLSQTSIEKKVAYYLLSRKAKEKEPFSSPMNRTQMADFMAITRPSLSRALAGMQQKGLLVVDGSSFTVLSLKALEKVLWN